MAQATWTGYLTFGMISVPVKLFAAARTEGISFNQVHQCNESTITRLNQQMVCSCCNKPVPSAEIRKGYEKAKGEFFIVTEAELDGLKPKKSDAIEVSNFVLLTEIDPIYFDKSYFIVPQAAGRKAYELLFQTMNNTGLAGSAKFTMRGKTYNVFVRTYGKGIMMHTVFAQAEVREIEEYEAVRDDVQVSDVELNMAKTLLQAMVVTFDPTKLQNDQEAKLKALVDAKIAGTAPQAGGPAAAAPVPDMMAALAASIAAIKPVEIPTEKKATKKVKAA